MFKNLTTIASLTALLTFASPVFAQSSWVKVGGLSCTMSPTIGLLVVEEQAVNCQFTPHGHYPSERYTGTIGTVGIAVGVIGGGMLAWRIHAHPGSVTRFARRHLRRSQRRYRYRNRCWRERSLGWFGAFGSAATDLGRRFGWPRRNAGRVSPHASMGAVTRQTRRDSPN